MNDLAKSYGQHGKYAQAEALFRQTLDRRRRILGAEHPHTLFTLSDMAFMYWREGKYARAATYAEQAVAGRRRIGGTEDQDTLDAELALALSYLGLGKFAECERLAREIMTITKKKLPDEYMPYHAEMLVGASLSGQKEYADAEPLLLEGYRGMLARKEQIGVPHLFYLDRSRDWILNLYQAWGKPEQATEWREKMQAAKSARQ